MFRKIKNEQGFTMIELMIVAIIVAILAVVLIPLMSGNKVRAYATECESALGTVRSALRVYRAEHNVYPTLVATDPITDIDGINSADLDGTYFSEECYSAVSSDDAFTVTCDWDNAGNTAPQAADVNYAYTTAISEDGGFTRTGY